MNKAQIIRHTKNYMDMLAQGVDPIRNEKIEADSVVLQPRMQKCFAFVAELLDELVENHGFVPLTSDDSVRYEIIEIKSAFSLSEEQVHRISVSAKPITPNAFLNNINRVVDHAQMEKLSIKSINAWLLAQGFITETKEPAMVNRTIRRPTDKSEIGIQEEEITDAETGEIKRRMVLTLQAQAYLLDHLNEIASLPHQ